ncbi:hypothetical protein [Synechococcus sp. RS9902]|uniref:hypothetical protein n=1 Tax=Synechococcus sp. RS9902 TaxID=221345 RepID=UPI0016468B85|nr:hypothetical protein [Synechococcus sp. RS9902]QNI98436.1 hypothetical protein SynRS9902_02565 [Synechococcus sp. RS9902]
MPSNGFSLELPIGKVSKVKDHHGDSIYSVDELGSFEGSFAIAHSKKELKQLMKSDADVVYDERKGKLYLNSNGEKKGRGNKKKSGLLANFKGKPELNAQNLRGFQLTRVMPSQVTTSRIRSRHCRTSCLTLRSPSFMAKH